MSPAAGPGIALILAFQEAFPWLAVPMLVFSLLGSPAFYVFLISAIYWCCDTRLALRAGILLAIGGALNDALKIAFHTPRPYWVSSAITAYAGEGSFGLPSAHAQLAVGFWGLLAASVRRWWAWLGATALVLCIGFSRIYLGVHFPIDVIAGWLVGIALLGGYLLCEPHAERWLAGRSCRETLLIIFLGSLLFPLLSWLALCSTGDWHLPASWVIRAYAETGEVIDPLSPAYTFVTAGLLFGLAVGWTVWHRHATPLPPLPRRWRMLRYTLGFVILALIWFGLGAWLPESPALLHYTVLYLHAALTGAWISAGAPALFSRLKLPSGPGG